MNISESQAVFEYGVKPDLTPPKLNFREVERPGCLLSSTGLMKQLCREDVHLVIDSCMQQCFSTVDGEILTKIVLSYQAAIACT